MKIRSGELVIVYDLIEDKFKESPDMTFEQRIIAVTIKDIFSFMYIHFYILERPLSCCIRLESEINIKKDEIKKRISKQHVRGEKKGNKNE